MNKIETNLNSLKQLNKKPEHSQINSIVNSLNEGLFEKAINDLDDLILEFPNAAILFNLKAQLTKHLMTLKKQLKILRKQ